MKSGQTFLITFCKISCRITEIPRPAVTTLVAVAAIYSVCSFSLRLANCLGMPEAIDKFSGRGWFLSVERKKYRLVNSTFRMSGKSPFSETIYGSEKFILRVMLELVISSQPQGMSFLFSVSSPSGLEPSLSSASLRLAGDFLPAFAFDTVSSMSFLSNP